MFEEEEQQKENKAILFVLVGFVFFEHLGLVHFFDYIFGHKKNAHRLRLTCETFGALFVMLYEAFLAKVVFTFGDHRVDK